MEGKSMNNRFSQNIPNLGSIHPSSGNSTEATEELANNSDRQSLIGRNNECVICMDNQRGASSKHCTSTLEHCLLISLIICRLRLTSVSSSVRLHQVRPVAAQAN